jgi:hypothetical protein
MHLEVDKLTREVIFFINKSMNHELCNCYSAVVIFRRRGDITTNYSNKGCEYEEETSSTGENSEQSNKAVFVSPSFHQDSSAVTVST